MNINIDRTLEHYSRVAFQNDLKNLNKDVYRRIYQSQSDRNEWKNLIERWFGMSHSLGAGIMASTLILGVFLGAQIQTGPATNKHDVLGFEVFRAESLKLPSSLLAPEL